MQKASLIDRIKALATPIEPKRFDHETRLQNLTGIKCVAFDFYGTMFISGVGDIGIDEEKTAAQEQIFEQALRQSHFSVSHPKPGPMGLQQFKKTIERHIKHKKENGVAYPEPNIIAVWKEVLATLVQLNFINGPVTRQKTIRFSIEYEFRTNTIWPVPDLQKILSGLLNQDLKLGIISNSQFYTPLAFEALMGQSPTEFGFDPNLLKWSFKEGQKKPSLPFYRKFTEELPAKNIAPHQVLYAGNDLFKDIIPAAKLGMKTALYVGDRRSLRHKKEDLGTEPHQPDIIIDELSQLLQCIS